jgi:regulator of replication initiation timing
MDEGDPKENELRNMQKRANAYKRDIDSLKSRLSSMGSENIIADLENQMSSINKEINSIAEENKKLEKILKRQVRDPKQENNEE